MLVMTAALASPGLVGRSSSPVVVSEQCSKAFADLAGDTAAPIDGGQSFESATLTACQSKAEWIAAAKPYQGGDEALFPAEVKWDLLFGAYCRPDPTLPACAAK